MSIHAELSEEAKARLDAMRRNSTISSVVIGILSVSLIALILGFILIPGILTDYEGPTAYFQEPRIDDPIDKPKTATSRQLKPSAPAPNRAEVIAVSLRSDLAIPVPDIDVVEPSVDYGNGSVDDFGRGMSGDGSGVGDEGNFRNFRADISKRCSREDRLQRLAETGGSEQCEDAVLKALRWMKQTQSADGSWSGQSKVAMTGLGLLAYLGHCETPMSEEFGESCYKAIIFLVNTSMSNDGKIADDFADKHWPYEHAIAVYALSEATTFCKQLNIEIPNLDDSLTKSGQLLIDHQHQSGGWDYAYAEDSARGGDVSIASWHLQALKAMKHTGIDFKNLTRCANRGLAYLADKQDSNGGFGYTSTKPLKDYYTLTGAGVLCLQMWGKGNQTSVRNGAEYIDKNTKLQWGTANCDLYCHYYEAQAMMNRGGEQWKRYNAMMRDEILKNQQPDGTWKSAGGHGAGTFYHTALCTLMLEVYYRFLPGTGANSVH